MYLTIQRGKHKGTREYPWDNYENNVMYYVGQPSWLDRAALARLTVESDSQELRVQNRRFYSFTVVSSLTVVMVFAAVLAVIVGDIGAFFFFLVVGGMVALVLNALFISSDSIGMGLEFSTAISARKADKWLSRKALNGRFLPVHEVKLLQQLQRESGYNLREQMATTPEIKTIVDGLLIDPSADCLQELIAKRPMQLEETDQERLRDLRAALDKRVKESAKLIKDIVEKRTEDAEAVQRAVDGEWREIADQVRKLG